MLLIGANLRRAMTCWTIFTAYDTRCRFCTRKRHFKKLLQLILIILSCCSVTSPLLLVAVLLSAGAAYAALLKYAESRFIVVGLFTGGSLFVKQLWYDYLLFHMLLAWFLLPALGMCWIQIFETWPEPDVAWYLLAYPTRTWLCDGCSIALMTCMKLLNLCRNCVC